MPKSGPRLASVGAAHVARGEGPAEGPRDSYDTHDPALALPTAVATDTPAEARLRAAFALRFEQFADTADIDRAQRHALRQAIVAAQEERARLDRDDERWLAHVAADPTAGRDAPLLTGWSKQVREAVDDLARATLSVAQYRRHEVLVAPLVPAAVRLGVVRPR